MRRRLITIAEKAVKHRYGATLLSFLAAAAATGAACVAFMRAFEHILENSLARQGSAWLPWLLAPASFLLSVELIRRLAPCADGAGIPQTIFAASRWNTKTEQRLLPLVSARTMAVKTLALFIGLWAGASTGREGPTVHVAACAYVGVLLILRRLTGLDFDLRSGIIAGGAAGLAAAFNTPLAGVTFAIEELSTDYFSQIKDYVLLAIIAAAVTAKSMTGEYAYFGRLANPPGLSLAPILLIGALCGLLGAAFSTLLTKGRALTLRLQNGAARYAVPVLLAWGVLAVARLAGPDMLGPGNQAAQKLLLGHPEAAGAAFPFAKMAATLMTYWSGIAGGIFAPCLAIGASLGAEAGRWAGASASSCALIGMAAFLAGVIQAPMTAFVIIFEMTGHHDMLLPLMLACLLAFMVAKLLGAKHLYQTLAQNYAHLIGGDAAAAAAPNR